MKSTQADLNNKSSMFMYFRFPAEIGQEMPVSWYYGSSPDAGDCLELIVVVAAVTLYSVTKYGTSSTTTTENTACVTLAHHVQLWSQVFNFHSDFPAT